MTAKKATTTQDLLDEATEETKPDPFDDFDITKPEYADPKDHLDYTKLTFGQRLARLREDKGYIQKLTGAGMDYSAVLYEDLVEQVRPLFLHYGLSWHTHACYVVGDQTKTTEFAGLLVTSVLMIFTIRFQNVEGMSAGGDDIVERDWVRDVTVPATAFDAFDPGADQPRGDTGAASAITTAQKYALRQILNLAAGDDPDFTPMISLSTRQQEERKVLILRLKTAIEAQGVDVDSNIAKIIENTNEKHHRSITSVEDVETGILRKWVIRAEDKAAAKEAADGNSAATGDGTGGDSEKSAKGSVEGEGLG